MPPPPPGSGQGGGPKWLVVAAIVLVVAIGVGATVVLTSGDDAPELAPPGLELDELQPALVDEDDLGGDWAEVDDAEPSETEEPEVSEECRRVQEERGDAANESLPTVFAVFRQQSAANPPGVLVHSFALVTEDMPSFDEVRESADVCDEETVDDGEVTTTTVRRLVDADELGDDVLAFETEHTVVDNDGDQRSSLTHGYELLVRRDGVLSIVVMSVGFVGAGSSDDEMVESGLPDVDLVHQLAADADERVIAVLDDQ